MASETEITSYKIIVVGRANVGKTTFIHRFRFGIFKKKYEATREAKVHSITFETNHGNYVFNIWDCPGHEKFKDSSYYKDADAALVLFDVTRRDTFLDVPDYMDEINKMAGDIPITVCGNKVDLTHTPTRRPQFLNISA